MKKLLLTIIILLALMVPGVAGATDYYGGAAGKNLNANDLWYIQSEVTGSCAATGSPVASATVLQAGNNLYANGCTIAITDSFTATKISTEDGDAGGSAVAGGGFTWATAGGNKTFTANIVAQTTDCLTISGSTSGAVGTIIGNLTGGNTSNANAVNTTHTVGTITIGSVGTPTTITGGSTAGGTHALLVGGTGPVTIVGAVNGGTFANVSGISQTANAAVTVTGNCTGGSAAGTYAINNASGSGTITISGDAIGGSADGADGVAATGTGGSITITGNIIATAYGVGARGRIIWAPSDATKYVKIIGDGTPAAYFIGQPPATNKVLSDAYVIDVTDGSYDSGTATAGGGGGAWGF